MLRHHYNARKARLQRLIAEGERRVAELAAKDDQTAVGKRLRTLAGRSLARHRQSLSNLIELHGEAFGEKSNQTGED